MKLKGRMTLDRVVSRMGIASRTSAREAIRAGRLKVNGRVIRDPETWVDPSRDTIHCDGQRLKPARPVYLLLYKPKGVITSHGDPQGRATVYDCLANFGRRSARKLPHEAGIQRAKPGDGNKWLFPVGRLDKDTSGLLLLTNDTDFADFITRPDSGVTKTYLAKINGLMQDDVITRLNRGVEMKRGDWSRPLSVRRVEDRGKYTWLEIVLTEGKNREVRRLLEAVGFKVLKLVRTSIGPWTLESLKIGHWRQLTPAEINSLRSGGIKIPAPPSG